jgi:5-hydroxyisourate hydrolase
VLDTERGRPAARVANVLRRGPEVLAEVVTDSDGRWSFGDVGAGVFELEFAIGDYFGSREFLDRVPIRFTMAEDAHYHVPLLASPWAYSTYRGS